MPQQNPIWENRIVRLSEEDPSDLLANPYNWRVHSALQQEGMTGVLSDVGFISAVIVNEVTQHMIDGHMRTMLALNRPGQKVPVLWVRLSEDEEAIALTTYDSLTDYAVTDKDKMRELLHRCSTGTAATMNLLSMISESNRLYKLDSVTGESAAVANKETADKILDLVSGASSESGSNTSGAPRTFTLSFDSEEQEARFINFKNMLGTDYAQHTTLGARLDQFLQDQGIEIDNY